MTTFVVCAVPLGRGATTNHVVLPERYASAEEALAACARLSGESDRAHFIDWED